MNVLHFNPDIQMNNGACRHGRILCKFCASTMSKFTFPFIAAERAAPSAVPAAAKIILVVLLPSVNAYTCVCRFKLCYAHVMRMLYV